MAWTARNLYVAAAERGPLLDALERLLADPAHRPDGEGLVSDPPPPLTVAPLVDGWYPVLGLHGWVADQPALAAALSAEPGVERVVSSELLGACYRLRHVEYRAGEQRAAELIPAEGWDEQGAERPMPLYRDVEQLCFALLRDLGLSATSALIGSRSPAGGELVSLGEATALSWSEGGEGLQRAALELSTEQHDDGADAPLLAREVGCDFGLHFFDDRFVEGAPSAAAVNRLLQLEDKQLARGRRLYGEGLTLTISYYSGGFQDELDALLVARDHAVPARTHSDAAPWWQFWRYFGKFG